MAKGDSKKETKSMRLAKALLQMEELEVEEASSRAEFKARKENLRGVIGVLRNEIIGGQENLLDAID